MNKAEEVLGKALVLQEAGLWSLLSFDEGDGGRGCGVIQEFCQDGPSHVQRRVAEGGPRIEKYDTWYRKSINPGCRLAITLHFLAPGEKYRSLIFGFRVAHNTISVIVRQTCEAILAEYGDKVLQCPHTSDAWKQVAAEFSSRWNFHHTLGTIDFKHVAIRCPKNGGSLYINYKGFHFIILLAMVDVKFNFLWVDVGTNGSSSDAQIFNKCDLRSGIVDGTLDIPDAEPLPRDDHDMPYFLIGDDAFSLRTWLMKPFSARGLPDEERICNYRLSHARRVVENATASHWVTLNHALLTTRSLWIIHAKI